MQKICFSLIFLFCAQNCLSMENEGRRLLPTARHIPTNFSSIANREPELTTQLIPATRTDGEDETNTVAHSRSTSNTSIIHFVEPSGGTTTTREISTSPMIHARVQPRPANPTVNNESSNTEKPLTKRERCRLISALVISGAVGTFFLYCIQMAMPKNHQGTNSTMIWPG